MSEQKTLYERLGGYDAIAAVANDLLPRLQADPQLGRFWAHRGADGIHREKQLLIDFLCSSAGGPVYYRGRDMVLIRTLECTGGPFCRKSHSPRRSRRDPSRELNRLGCGSRNPGCGKCNR